MFIWIFLCWLFWNIARGLVYTPGPGAGSLPDRTRRIPLNMFLATGGSTLPVTDVHGTLSGFPHIHLPDAATTDTQSFGYIVPSDMVGNFTITYVWTSTVGGNNIRMQTLHYSAVAGGTTHTALIADTSTVACPAVANTFTFTQVSGGSAPAAGTLCIVDIARLGADGADSNTGQVSLWGAYVEYTADM